MPTHSVNSSISMPVQAPLMDAPAVALQAARLKSLVHRCGRTAAAAVLSMAMGTACAAGTLRIAMTASDIPLPNGQTDQGAEGMRFMGYSLFEALVACDLSSADKPSALVPGLATEWMHDNGEKTRWTCSSVAAVRKRCSTFNDTAALSDVAAQARPLRTDP
jgi:hypothetical protein